MAKGLSALSSRAVVGWYLNAKKAVRAAGWVDPISMYITSDQETETHTGLGAGPVMRERKGQLNIARLMAYPFDIKNLPFDASMEIPVDWMRRDKTGQIRQRIAELARAGEIHWRSLLSTLLVNGESGLCYDGKYFFAANHVEGKSGTQSNLLTASDIAALEVVAEATPTASEMISAIVGVIAHMTQYKDDQGDYAQEDAQQFLVMCGPNPVFQAALTALTAPMVSSTSNVLPNYEEMKISVVQNPRLSSWTSTFAVFATDYESKALIRQEEVKPELKVVAEGSERETTDGTHLYSEQTTRNAGYGDWRKCAKCTLSTAGE